MGVTASRLTAQTEPSQSTPSNIREAEADTAVERQCLTQTGPAGATEAVVAARLSSFLASLAPPAAPQPRPRVELDRTHKVTIVSLSPSCTAVKRRASDTSLASYHTSPRKRSTPLAVSAVPAPTAVVSPPSTPQKPSSYSSWQPYEDDNDPCDSVPTPEIFKMPVDFKDVKDWIAEQERLKNRPPLTDAQKRALADLRAAIVENTPEPEISAEDWVTALQWFKDSHRPSSVEIIYEPSSSSNGIAWHCLCRYSGPGTDTPVTLPSEERGYVTNSKGISALPSFAQKKSAKRYAAQCLVHWLLDNGQSVKVPKLPQQAAGAAGSGDGGAPIQPHARSLPAPVVTVAASPVRPTPALTPANTAFPPTPSDQDDDGPPATEQVRDLCQRLGLQAPAYRVMQSASGIQGFWDGWADFQQDAVHFTSGGHAIGPVKDCYGKKATREQIASGVLKELFRIREERESVLRSMEDDA